MVHCVVSCQENYDSTVLSSASSRLKTNSDGADVTSAGKLFQTSAAVTEKERSPMVERRITGTRRSTMYGVKQLITFE